MSAPSGEHGPWLYDSWPHPKPPLPTDEQLDHETAAEAREARRRRRLLADPSHNNNEGDQS